MSASNYFENKVGNALRGGGNGTDITAPANLYLKLHTGDPGEDATSNAAGNTTRQECTFGASSNGVIALSNTPAWTNVSTAETYSHASVWDHVSAGNAIVSGALTAPVTVAVGDNFSMTAWTVTTT